MKPARGLCWNHYSAAYSQRPEVREKRRAYHKERSARIKRALALLKVKEAAERIHEELRA